MPEWLWTDGKSNSQVIILWHLHSVDDIINLHLFCNPTETNEVSITSQQNKNRSS